MEKKLTIIIPVYNQILLTRRCLYYLSKQTYKNFLVILQDDASKIYYEGLINEFPYLEIVYIKNKQNIGALNNMINCLTKNVSTEFIMCMHEDDFIHQEYLKLAIEILEKNNDVAFVGSPAYFFNQDEKVNKKLLLKKDYIKYNIPDFINYILNGNRFVFGSIIYKKELIRSQLLDINKYNAFFDRPFLLAILENSKKNAVILKDKFYYYQNHIYPDKRWENLSQENIINLYSYYEKLFSNGGKYTTSQYIFDFANLDNKKWSNFFYFLKQGKKNGIVDWHRISWKFIFASFFIFIFGKKNYYYCFIFFKKITK